MARIRVRNKLTGQTGTLPEENFNPLKYELLEEVPQAGGSAQPVRQQPSGGFGGYLPGITAAAPTTLASFMTKARIPTPVSAGLGAAGGALAHSGEQLYRNIELLSDFLKGKPITQEDIKERGIEMSMGEQLSGLGKSAAAGAGAELLGQLIAGAGSKIMGPAIKRIPIQKFRTPRALQEGISEALLKVGSELEDILDTGANKTISKSKVLKEVGKIKDDLVKGRGYDPKDLPAVVKNAIKRVDRVIERIEKVRGDITPKIANRIKADFWWDIYGERGQELAKRGLPGITEKRASKVAAGTLREEIAKAVPEATKPMDIYHALGLFAKEMELPFKGWWKGGLVGAMGAPQPVSASVTTLAMPYTRALLRKFIGSGISALRRPAQVSTYNDLRNFLFGGGNR